MNWKADLSGKAKKQCYAGNVGAISFILFLSFSFLKCYVISNIIEVTYNIKYIMNNRKIYKSAFV